MPRTFILIFLLYIAVISASAEILPHEALVIYAYNNNSTPGSVAPNNYDWSSSKNIADYYCAARGIPAQNQFGINWTSSNEAVTASDFNKHFYKPLTYHP